MSKWPKSVPERENCENLEQTCFYYYYFARAQMSIWFQPEKNTIWNQQAGQNRLPPESENYKNLETNVFLLILQGLKFLFNFILKKLNLKRRSLWRSFKIAKIGSRPWPWPLPRPRDFGRSKKKDKYIWLWLCLPGGFADCPQEDFGFADFPQWEHSPPNLQLDVSYV